MGANAIHSPYLRTHIVINGNSLGETGPVLCYNSFENACQALARIDLWSEEYYTLIREIHSTELGILAMSNLWGALNHTFSHHPYSRLHSFIDDTINQINELGIGDRVSKNGFGEFVISYHCNLVLLVGDKGPDAHRIGDPDDMYELKTSVTNQFNFNHGPRRGVNIRNLVSTKYGKVNGSYCGLFNPENTDPPRIAYSSSTSIQNFLIRHFTRTTGADLKANLRFERILREVNGSEEIDVQVEFPLHPYHLLVTGIWNCVRECVRLGIPGKPFSSGGIGEIVLALCLNHLCTPGDKGADAFNPANGDQYEYKVSTTNQYNFQFGMTEGRNSEEVVSNHFSEIDYAILGKREGSRITEIHAARSFDIVQYLISHFQSHGVNQLQKNFRIEEFISQEWSFEWPE